MNLENCEILVTRQIANREIDRLMDGHSYKYMHEGIH